VTIQINFFLILPLPDETQKWKYFTQKFQIISQKKKKNPPGEVDSRPLSLNLREIGHIPIQTLFWHRIWFISSLRRVF
jgi:hypothetical protein